MKRSLITLALTAAITLPMTSCFTMTHQMGSGGTEASSTSERQWFILFGLITLNDIESHDMAAGATDYTVTTEWTFLDVVINIFTWPVTVLSQNVTVDR
jgi:hypothetical protein